MRKDKKKPDEVNSYEFLLEHLYETTKERGFEAEFKQIKEVLPYLERFERLVDFMVVIEKEPAKIPDNLLDDLVNLYQSRRDIRPATIIIIMLILWNELESICGRLPEKKYGGLDERFADIYWHLLSIMKDPQIRVNAKAIVISRLRSKFRV